MNILHIKKQLLTVALATIATGAMAQSINSAYYTEDYKFRHDLNPAFGNEQNYISIPALGNISVNTHGNFGYQDVVMEQPYVWRGEWCQEDDNLHESLHLGK